MERNDTIDQPQGSVWLKIQLLRDESSSLMQAMESCVYEVKGIEEYLQMLDHFTHP